MSYEKNEWVNNVSDIDEEKMNHIEDGIYQNSIEIANLKNVNAITARMNANLTLSTSGENKLPLAYIARRVGTGFTVSNGRIYVGAGINYVLVSASVYSNRSSSAGSAYNAYIYKNGIGYINSINSGPSGQRNETTAIAPQVMDVQQGDYFELGCYGYEGDVISAASGTNLTLLAIS